MEPAEVLENVTRLSAEFAAQRKERQLRRELAREDFTALAQAGFLLTGVRRERGGLWSSVRESTRPTCDLLRALAHGDPSVALVSSMHPAVLSFWLAAPEVDAPARSAWHEQLEWLERTALEGRFWGTITSEPGSGGDIAKTKATARPAAGGAGYELSGAKHFGSGSGITSYMITTALPEGEEEPDLFFMDVADASWDGTAGVTLVKAWDGSGMAATQSHAMRFDRYPAQRCAWPGHLKTLTMHAGPHIACSFSAVIVGVCESAMESARAELRPRRDTLRPYEQVEWTRAEMTAWTIEQAYQGMLRAVETERDAAASALRGKMVIAELAEDLLSRLCKVLGGGTFSRSSPFSHWYQDVRALGFLRPPWGLAFDQILASSALFSD